ncbi:MAG: creatininase family protein [Thermoplasmatota archaeon]
MTMKDGYSYFNDMTMDDLKDPSDLLLLFPLGISEGHGKHLPVGTDTIQAEYVVEKVAERSDRNCVIAPVLNYGHCRATSHLQGTLSISFDGLRSIVKDILHGLAEQGFKRFALISGHAGGSHLMALRLAVEEVLEDYDIDVILLSDYHYAYDFKGDEVPDTDGHGGEIETSRILDISPELVKDDRPKTTVEYPKFKVIGDYSSYLKEGMRGDAGKATEEEGRKINEYVVSQIVKLIEEELYD